MNNDLHPQQATDVFGQAKNLFVTEKEGVQEKEIVVDTESSSTETSSSASEVEEMKEWRTTHIRGTSVLFDLCPSAAYTAPRT